jgi:hypothetical protein
MPEIVNDQGSSWSWYIYEGNILLFYMTNADVPPVVISMPAVVAEMVGQYAKDLRTIPDPKQVVIDFPKVRWMSKNVVQHLKSRKS